ncbi:maleylpyruvate isomerase family mycothiol-dependent enzyme [Actinosynnema sp. NPDC047251]|uniref:Mycothiol-dependent maleylpyruvate isomerase metal-binding domain-containing protein n=1 Tax=Saccharothrix espanaensis (strain ATCC 51144 / DSM 44229 / JCM 9112 / NBRC 15066 / NRRL 15764) TaxID=1179773 RepID=K0JXS6_SACES|nr:maleylpyruvate isomerase family mycothiol-dependent enzyme [Saccharothrix espanaensis]CCH32730.1 hypothetical protein BN6_54710 [Saccharothrix espanaensis DSM 44229]
MSELVDRTITVLRSSHDDLDAMVAGLSEADLQRRSAAADWTVAQVFSHLGSGAELLSATLEEALTGAEPTETPEQVWARWNALPPREQAAGFRAADDELVRRFEALDAQARANLKIDLGFLGEPLDVAGVGALRLNEVALHGWDVRAAFDPAAVVASDAVEFLYRTLDLLIGMIGRPAELQGRQGVVEVVTTGPARTFWLDLRETAAITDAPATPVVGRLTLPAEAFLRLAAGRLAPERTPPGTILTSDSLSLDDLRRVFPGF